MSDIILKNRDGDDVTYPGVEAVKLVTADGGTQVFSKGQAVEGMVILPDFSAGDQDINAPEGILVKSATIQKPSTLIPENIAEGVNIAGIIGTVPNPEILENLPIALDFSGGNQSIVAPDGQVVKSAIIQKPATLTPDNIRAGTQVAGVEGAYGMETETRTVALDFSAGDQVIQPTAGKLLSAVTVQQPDTLIPENIAEGVNIAGIVGALAAGSSVKTAMGTIAGNGGSMVIAHGMGVVPDMVFIKTSTVNPSPTSAYLISAFGASSAFGKLCNYAMNLQEFSYIQTNGTTVFNTQGTGIQANVSYTPINNVNANSFTVGSNYVLYKDYTYKWFAIGGLT